MRPMKQIEATPANIMTLARRLAERLVKAEWQAQGIRVAYVDRAALQRAAQAYLNEHRDELVAAARVWLASW